VICSALFGSTAAIIGALASGLLYLSNPTLPERVGSSVGREQMQQVKPK